MAKVYLAGGMRTGWQQTVIQACPHHQFINPCDRNGVVLDQPSDYTAWDLAAVQRSEIVFGYMEASNPSGVGLASECGYGRGLNKLIVFVDESNNRYFRFLQQLADVHYPSLAEGIEFLKSVTW